MVRLTVNAGRVDHFAGSPRYILEEAGGEYTARNCETGRIDYYGTTATGGAFMNNLINATTDRGGVLYFKDLITVDDVDVTIPAGNGELIFEGLGRFTWTDDPAGNFTTYAQSGLLFDGVHITNALGAFRRGRVQFRDMNMGFTGVTSDHLIPTDYLSYIFSNVLFQEWGNTFAAGEGVLCPIGASPTPASQKTIVRDCYFHMKSSNCVAIGAHYENLDVYSPTFSLQTTNQVGISFKGVGIQSVYSPLIWLGSSAGNCEVFQLYNSAKHVGIYNISGSHQAGGIAAPCSLFGTVGGTWTNTDINLIAWNINGDVEWLYEAAATDFAVWEDGDAQERVLILGQVEGTYVPSYRQIPFMNERASVQLPNPNTAYVVFDADMTTTINLDLAQHTRVCGKAQGNEATADKGVCIYNITDAEVLCEYTWDGNAVTEFEGLWTNVGQVGATQLNVYVKGSSATEDIDLWKVWLELR